MRFVFSRRRAMDADSRAELKLLLLVGVIVCVSVTVLSRVLSQAPPIISHPYNCSSDLAQKPSCYGRFADLQDRAHDTGDTGSFQVCRTSMSAKFLQIMIRSKYC